MRIEDSLRRVDSTRQAERLFERRVNTQGLRLFLERCDEVLLEDAKEGLRMAQLAAAVATRIDDPDQQASALAVLGGAYRRSRLFTSAEETFSRGLHLAPRNGLAWADLLQRRSVLRVDLGQLDGALSDADEAVASRRLRARFGHRECETLPCALVVRGNVYIRMDQARESLIDNIEALTVTTPLLTPRTYALALSNVDTLQEAVPFTLKEVSHFMRMLKEALKRLTPRHEYPRLKLQWVLAQQLRRLGSTRKAEKLLVKIRPGLLRIHWREFLCASLDLADIYEFHEDREGLAHVLSEMAAAVASAPESVEAGVLLAAAADGFSDPESTQRLRATLKNHPMGTA